ncbi:hypothetical protein [Halotia branconii]|uniref:Uncharacterized protein n=1 Tax=Halotia branconii CENA392 TaxID=1539056 RepID=A0AAJ6NS19_9CYAN|nr:hypothetical protein [Halotia branconii]WGV25684.1 hypothetical protein QI031_28855 [Halotia branconii CENA392]
MAETEPQKIVVEVPSDRSSYAPFPMPQASRMEEFKKGWINAIALPDNPTDLVFEITAYITIPALITSCWASFPIPGFLRVGALIAVGVSVLVLWQMLAITEIKNYLTFRLILIAVGAAMGL